MFRLYTDLFYQDTNLKAQFKKNYSKLLTTIADKINAKPRKNGKLVSLTKIINKRIRNLYSKYKESLIDLPMDFIELVLLSPEKIAKIYKYYESNIVFKNDVKKEFGTIYGARNGKISVLPFDKFSEKIAEFILEDETGCINTIQTCFYCNKSYINSYKTKEDISKRQFDLDHFIPKTKCPMFALCLYNLVPSCQICNSRIKSTEEYYKGCSADEIVKLMPTSERYCYYDSLKFRIVPTKPLFDDDIPFDEFKNKKNCFRIELEHCDEDSILYEKESEGFDIINRYDYHKREFLAHIDKARKYPPSYFLLLAQIKSPVDSSDLQEAIFDTKLRNDEKMIFQKIYNDIDDNL